MPSWLLDAMIVWSLFAVGGVYVWAGVPLIVAAALLVVIARPTPGTSRETRALDLLLLASVVAAVAQLVPLPPAVLGAVAPHADGLRSALYLGRLMRLGGGHSRYRPGWTAYALGARDDRARGVLDRAKGLRARHVAADRAARRVRRPGCGTRGAGGCRRQATRR